MKIVDVFISMKIVGVTGFVRFVDSHRFSRFVLDRVGVAIFLKLIDRYFWDHYISVKNFYDISVKIFIQASKL